MYYFYSIFRFDVLQFYSVKTLKPVNFLQQLETDLEGSPSLFKNISVQRSSVESIILPLSVFRQHCGISFKTISVDFRCECIIQSRIRPPSVLKSALTKTIFVWFRRAKKAFWNHFRANKFKPLKIKKKCWGNGRNCCKVLPKAILHESDCGEILQLKVRHSLVPVSSLFPSLQK